jgi:uncharacterized glyoxalase superfamily metalloenzyme YdcJ
LPQYRALMKLVSDINGEVLANDTSPHRGFAPEEA